MPRLKAYEVRDDYEGHCVIRFATSSAQARREGAQELEIDWESVEHCRRKPEFDEYAPGPVPKMALLDAGWWFDCHCHDCARTIELGSDDEEDADGDPLPSLDPVELGAWLFCTPECAGRHCAWWRGRQAAQAALCELIYTRFPDAHIVRAHVYGDRLTPPEYQGSVLVGGIPCLADFKLPGLTHPVTYHFGDSRVWVSTVDEAAFRTRYGAEGVRP